MTEAQNDAVESEAMTWLARSTSGSMDAIQMRAFEDWLASNPTHRRAYAEAKALWHGLEPLRTRPVVQDNLSNQGARALRRAPSGGALEGIGRLLRAPRIALIAASLLMVAVLGPRLVGGYGAQYRAGVGELRTISLDDGSQAFLDSESAMNVDYRADRRGLELLGGEAEFVVTKDKARPFVVQAGKLEVKALGTDFVVKRQTGGWQVGVIESAVELSEPQNSGFAPLVLRAGEQAIIEDSQSLAMRGAFDPRHAAAWRNQRLVFESVPLEQVVDDINRHRKGHIFLGQPDLKDLRVSGVFNLNQIDEIMPMLGKTLGIRSVALGQRYVVLY